MTHSGGDVLELLDRVTQAAEAAEAAVRLTGTAAVHGDGSGFVVAAAGTRDESGTAMLVTCAAR